MAQSSSQYDPRRHEAAVYKRWEEAGAFQADRNSSKESFTISMPPPNATGQLHLGHALFLSIQDAIIRYQRMLGKEALWLPGTDHAAIATESVVINLLRQQGIEDPRRQLGRKELVKRIAGYVENSRDTIRSQIRSLGASCDWSRERYTLEPALNRIISLVFQKMYGDGLIYRGWRIVNWDPRLQTTVSDDEVERREEKVPFYHLKYGPFVIGTARPETKFGDKYVVMHPEDERYRQYEHGDTFKAEWIGGPVTATVIKDEAADPAFGTGVMTITPWHDAADFEIAERHSLDKEQIIGWDGRLLPVAGKLAGLTIEEARPKIVSKLKKKGLLVGVDENYIHNVAVNRRGKGVIEPQIKLQWFVNVNKKVVYWKGKRLSFREVMRKVVEDGDIRILPPRYMEVYFRWIDDLRDWCISRQIWWGHRIPVWYRGEEVYAGAEPPSSGEGWTQDNDTLDTWFSSALWTWSTLIDRQAAASGKGKLEQLLENSPDYQKFHPTDLMETGHDILFFWVARMILMTTYVTGEVPFKDVYLHGLIAARTGKKMSKSDPDSIIDPLETIDQFGSDATRFGLIYQLAYGSQITVFDREAIKAARNFVNKVWNLSRLLQSTGKAGRASSESRDGLTAADWWIEKRCLEVTALISELLDNYQLGEASRRLYEFVWSDFADWYAEILKVEGSVEKAREVFGRTLKLLHPFLPHLTELLWEQYRPADGQKFLAAVPWPEKTAVITEEHARAGRQMDLFKDVVNTVRGARTLLGVAPGAEINLWTGDLPPLRGALARMGRVKIVDAPAPDMKKFPLAGGGVIGVSSREITDESVKRAVQRLEEEQRRLEEFIQRTGEALAGMRGRAPEKIIREKEGAMEQARQKIEEIAQSKKML